MTFIGCDPWSNWQLILRLMDHDTLAQKEATVADDVARSFASLGLEITPPLMQWSPDGRYAYFLGTSKFVTNVWRIEVDQASFRVVGGPQRVTMDQGRDTSFAVAPDGRRIAFSTARGNARVWLFRLTAGGTSLEDGPRVLTGPDDNALTVDLAPRGNTLAVGVERPGTAHHARELRAIRIADGHQTTLAVFDSERGLNFFAPRWSPDETRIAYRLTERGPSGSFLISIHTVDMGGVDRQVTTPANTGLEVPYGWTNDGRAIVAATNRPDANRSFTALLPLAGSPAAEAQAVVLTSSSDAGQYQQAFSPDGEWMVFNAVGNRDGRTFRIYVIRGSGVEWLPITDGTACDDKPRWSQDGRFIYFVSSRGGTLNVWGIPFDGTRGAPGGTPFQLTRFSGPGEQLRTPVDDVEIGVGGGWLAVPVLQPEGSVWMLEPPDGTGRH